MKTYRFDPEDVLSIEDVTQILRELYLLIPEAQVIVAAQACPTFAQHLVENEEYE